MLKFCLMISLMYFQMNKLSDVFLNLFSMFIVLLDESNFSSSCVVWRVHGMVLPASGTCLFFALAPCQLYCGSSAVLLLFRFPCWATGHVSVHWPSTDFSCCCKQCCICNCTIHAWEKREGHRSTAAACSGAPFKGFKFTTYLGVHVKNNWKIFS